MKECMKMALKPKKLEVQSGRNKKRKENGYLR